MRIAVREERLIHAPRDVVYEFVTAPDAVARTFSGFGPIPRALRSYSADGAPLRAGSIRVVENADGSVVEEELIELEAPGLQSYRLIRGLPPVFAALVDQPGGRWTFRPEATGTRVTWQFDFPLRGWWAAPVVFLLSRFFKGAMRRCLANTASQLEPEFLS